MLGRRRGEVKWPNRPIPIETPVRGEVSAEVTPAPGPTPPATGIPPQAGDGVRFEVGMSLEDLEREAIVRTLASVDGNRRRAADMLGIGERTLYRKLKQYGL